MDLTLQRVVAQVREWHPQRPHQLSTGKPTVRERHPTTAGLSIRSDATVGVFEIGEGEAWRPAGWARQALT